MWAAIGTGDEIAAAQGGMEGKALVAGVSTAEPYRYARAGRVWTSRSSTTSTKKSILRRSRRAPR